MPIAIIALFTFVMGITLIISFFYHMFDFEGNGFKGFAAISFFVLPLFVGSIFWISNANMNRIESNESFHSAFVLTQDGENIQFIVGKHDDKIVFVNLGEKLNGTVTDGVFVRRYCFEESKYGIDFITTEGSYKYELIGPDHERYEEVKKQVEQGQKNGNL